ncbi:hypothetical protein DOTSEDRAFT_76988 [Dothistroma septosporum NZE10]|uniref:Uncharacterized protein n=1 Tax=Dothistroma septosporum (strain NZE10 / CBS 128990) TaxID=675120 RepID=N1Q3I6_DOTSN|nr:hypothetical protein DOTSEDRAFT_76988 [Dothistroma septosporum NZE10]
MTSPTARLHQVPPTAWLRHDLDNAICNSSVVSGKEIERHSVRCVEVKKTAARREQRWTDVFFRGHQPTRTPLGDSGHETKDSRETKPGRAALTEQEVPPFVKAKALGPLTWVTLIGFSEAAVLFIASIVFGGGMSILATILLSGLSTVIGAIDKRNLEVTQRPKGDAPRAWLEAYVIIDIAHWFAAALPQDMHWDLSCYEVQEHGIEGGPHNTTFTEALWKAIALTKSAQWIFGK